MFRRLPRTLCALGIVVAFATRSAAVEFVVSDDGTVTDKSDVEELVSEETLTPDRITLPDESFPDESYPDESFPDPSSSGEPLESELTPSPIELPNVDYAPQTELAVEATDTPCDCGDDTCPGGADCSLGDSIFSGGCSGCGHRGCGGGCRGGGSLLDTSAGFSSSIFGPYRQGCRGWCDGTEKWFIDGWIAQGFTANTADPVNNFNLPVTFNDRANEYQLNQVYLSVGRNVRESGNSWDMGARLDLLYGTDYFFTQALGLETRDDGSPRWNSSDGPRGTGAALYGLAMPQLYGEVYIPILGGMNLKAGHFYTTLGYESVMAPENFFYSHAYTMQYGEPFTHTGVLTNTTLAKGFDAYFGYTRGWDSVEDNNRKPGYLFGFSWCPSENASLAFGVHTGREDDAGINDRTVYSLVYTRQITKRLQYILQHDFGTETNAEVTRDFQTDSAKWYGINQYFFYQMSQAITWGMRVEWFRDQDNARVLGIPIESLVEGGNYVGLSLGVNWRPNCRWIFRPEIRYDWSDAEAPGLGHTGMFDTFTDEDQLTLAFDSIFRF